MGTQSETCVRQRKQTVTNTNCPSTSQSDSEPKTGQRIVFLDLEGVVVTHKSILATHLPALAGAKIDGYTGGGPDWANYVDRVAYAMILRVCQKHGAKIVLTSVLRTRHEVRKHLLDLAEILLGSSPTHLFHSCPVTEHSDSREEEIRDWILFEEKATGSELESFCVIDDRRLEIENFVQVDQRDGFSYDNYMKAQNFLVRDPKPELIFL